MNHQDNVDRLFGLFVAETYLSTLEELIKATTNVEETFISLKVQKILLARFKSLFLDETLEERCQLLLLQFLYNIISCTEHLVSQFFLKKIMFVLFLNFFFSPCRMTSIWRK
jgi:hypothetical protein